MANKDSVCCIGTKKVYLFNRCQRWKQKNKKQENLRSKKQNVLTEEVTKTALSANDDKRLQSIDSIEA